MQTKTIKIVDLQTKIQKSQLWSRLTVAATEIIDAFLVIGTVIMIGMIGLYYQVFIIEINDLLGYSKQGVVVQEVQAFSIKDLASSVVETFTDSEGTSTKELLANAVQTKKDKNIGSQQLYSYSLDQYLKSSLVGYELPVSSIPPGRFISIPKLGVQAPIVQIPYASEDKIKNGDFDEELKQGVVKYPHTTIPGKPGNTLVFGHSSIDTFQQKDNDFGYIFYKLPKLVNGDLIQVVWDGEIFEYEVSDKQIKWPKDVPEEVNKKTDVDMLTLMACYPLMSDAQRILVKALPKKKKDTMKTLTPNEKTPLLTYKQ